MYIACSPKSNAVYLSFKSAVSAEAEYGSLDVPLHLRNTRAKIMKQLDYMELKEKH